MNKICTSIEQSKKLIELGIDVNTADMHYWLAWSGGVSEEKRNTPKVGKPRKDAIKTYWCPCWSLAALLSVLPDESDIVKGKVDVVDDKYMCTTCVKEEIITTFSNNPIDACVALIEKLHELKHL